MTEQDRRKAWGYSLFGDDLRQEAGGKISLMGIYQEDMIFHGDLPLPIAVAKFVVFISYYELRGELETDVTFKISQGDESNVLTEFHILRKDMPVAKDAEVTIDKENPDDIQPILHARIPIIMSPFVVNKFGRLKVRARYSDGAVLKLGSINIKHMTLPEVQELLARNAENLTPKSF